MDSTGTVLKRFEAQRSRGTTSFGFYVSDSNKLCHNVKEGRIKTLLKREKGSDILFHHRFSTSTPDVRNACHPFSTKQYFESEYIGVHNGVVTNPTELRIQHQERGIQYVSVQPDDRFNDSEALIYDLARYMEGEVDSLTARGTIAFVMIKRNKAGKPVTLFFGRNYGNPLKMKKTDNSLTISSTGEGEQVEPNQLYSFDYDTKKIRKRPLTIPSGYYGGSYRQSKGYQPGWYSKPSPKAVAEPKKLESGSKNSVPHIDIRKGSYESVKNQFLEEADGDYATAAINAIGEAEEGLEILTRAEDIIESIPADNEDDMESCIDSYNELESYVRMLEHIADELEQRSTGGDSCKRDDILPGQTSLLGG